MSELRDAFLRGLADPTRTLETALDATASGTERSRDTILTVAHQLKGSGGSFGFPEVTDAAAAVLEAKGRSFETTARFLLELIRGLVSTESPAESLLIVEDDPALTLLIQTALKPSFDRIETARSIADARAVLEDFIPSLVLLDLGLPDGDGRDFLTELRSGEMRGNARIAVMSAHSRPDVKQDCLTRGADSYLQKPLDPAAISGQVAEILSGRPASQAPGSGNRGRGSSGKWQRARVLVAEDDPLTAGLVADRLRRRGYEVFSCEDGQAALETARSRNLALAIIDVNMPRMNGFELLTRLRRMKRHAQTPVLVLTTLTDERSVVRAFELGANDYMLKPFSPSELTARAFHLIGE